MVRNAVTTPSFVRLGVYYVFQNDLNAHYSLWAYAQDDYWDKPFGVN